MIIRVLAGLLLMIVSGCCKEFKDVVFGRAAGEALTLDGWVPDRGGTGGAVIMVHGGGWEAGDKRTYIKPWFDVLTKAGIAWFTVNYRLAPKHPHPAAVEDVEQSVKWVRLHAREYGVNSERLVLMGESAGAHIAALAALRGNVKVAGLVGFYGIYDVPSWKLERGGLPANIALYLPKATNDALREASPTNYLKPGIPPVLMIHGTADAGVPFAQSVRFCEAAIQVGTRCEVQLIEGAPHGVENWEKESRFQVWKPKVVEWLQLLVKPQ